MLYSTKSKLTFSNTKLKAEEKNQINQKLDELLDFTDRLPNLKKKQHYF